MTKLWFPESPDHSQERLSPSAAFMRMTRVALAIALTFNVVGRLTAQDTNVPDAASADKKSPDPWAENQGWPGQTSINREGGHTWWNTNLSDWPQWERGTLRLGGMVADFDTSLSFSINNAAGISINAEELLGLESNLKTFRADGSWRFGKTKRNTVDFTYAAYNRSATGTAAVDIDLGNGTVIPVGARLDTLFNFDIIRATYTFAFFQDKRLRLAAGLGAYVLPLEYGLTATPINNGSPIGFDEDQAILPLPALAFRGEYRITPKFYMYTDIDFMYAEIGDFTGKLIDLRLGVEYQIWRYFGLGIGYNTMNIDVAAASSADYIGDFVGDVDVKFGGLMLYGKFSF